MRYASIRSFDVSNGLDIGISLFTQGCPFHCHGCWNETTWDYNSGKEFTDETQKQILELSQNPHIKRFSVLGGEPLIKTNLKELTSLLSQMKSIRPDIKIWVFTGFTFEDILDKEEYAPIFQYIDILKDGDYQEDKRDLTLNFRGSTNQRLIDLQQTLKNHQLTLLDLK